MRRFFTEPENITENTAYLYEDAGHITKVLRMQEGDEILIFDGTGYEYTANFQSLTRIVAKQKLYQKNFLLLSQR